MKETTTLDYIILTNYKCLLPKKEPPNENCKNILLCYFMHCVEDRLTMKLDENMSIKLGALSHHHPLLFWEPGKI